MKILFVCRGNIGRSQAATEIYNADTDVPAQSAGTQVYDEAKLVGDRAGAASIIQAVKDEGLDISQNTSTQITPDMVANYDKVIVMAELSSVPHWLQDSSKVEMWEIPDLKDVTPEEAKDTLGLIKQRVAELKTKGSAGAG